MEAYVYFPPSPGATAGSDLCRPSACWLSHREFLCAAVLLCLEATVSLLSPIPSDSVVLPPPLSHSS